MNPETVRKLTYYLQLVGEDVESLHFSDAIRFRNLVDEYCADEQVKPNLSAEHLVKDIGVDEYLRQADLKILELTPPKTFEDRVKRFLYAIAAACVFNEFKFPTDFEELLQALPLKEHLMDQWRATRLPSRVPPHPIDSNMSTPPSRRNPLTPPSSHHSGGRKRLSPAEVNEILHDPDNLLERRFVSPPAGSEEESGEFWVKSIRVRRGDRGIEREYSVWFEVFGSIDIPIGEEDLRALITEATFHV